jgi:hypothetical protein
MHLRMTTQQQQQQQAIQQAQRKIKPSCRFAQLGKRCSAPATPQQHNSCSMHTSMGSCRRCGHIGTGAADIV